MSLSLSYCHQHSRYNLSCNINYRLAKILILAMLVTEEKQ